jgi:signal transduction histidine kinase
VKFTDRLGKIMILVEYQNKPNPNNPEDFIRISITDSGIGIKKKNQDKLFKMFGSIKDEKKKINTQGIGLGLVISKLIVNKFGGIIDFFSKYREGSTFFYTIQLEKPMISSN